MSAALNCRHDELAVALDREHAPPLQPRRHMIGISAAQHAYLAEFRRHDPPADEWRERSDYSFYFGKFGQSGHLKKDFVAFHFDFVSGNPLRRIVVVFSRHTIELPQVIRAYDAAVVQLSLPQWTA